METLSKKDIDNYFNALSSSGAGYSALGTGLLGSLLGAGIGGYFGPKDRKLLSALIGAGAGGIGGGALGYYGSKAFKPYSYTYLNRDTARHVPLDLGKGNFFQNWLQDATGDKLTKTVYDEETRPISLAEFIGAYTNSEFLEALNEQGGTNFPESKDLR